MISATDARNIIVNDEKAKVFKDIENYAKKGKYEVGLLQMSEDVEIELVNLGYDVTRDEGGVFINWETPKPIEIDVVEFDNTTPTHIEEPILDKPVYTDDTLNQPIESEVVYDDIV